MQAQPYTIIRITDHRHTFSWRLDWLKEVYRALSQDSRREIESAVLNWEQKAKRAGNAGMGPFIFISTELMDTLTTASQAIDAQAVECEGHECQS